MKELIVKFYVNKVSKTRLEALISEINFNDRDKFEIDFRKNDEYNATKAVNCQDGFLYFPFFIEYYKEKAEFTDEDVTNTKMILEQLRKNNIPVVTSCDFEDIL